MDGDRGCLPVDDCVVDRNTVVAAEAGDISAMSANEYMVWVKQQAEGLPDVVRVEHHDMGSITTCSYAQCASTWEQAAMDVLPCPKALIPDKQWQNEILEDFGILVEGLASSNGDSETMKYAVRKIVVPPLKNSRGWMQFCFGTCITEEFYRHRSIERCGHEDVEASCSPTVEKSESSTKVFSRRRGTRRGKPSIEIGTDNVDTENGDNEELLESKKRKLLDLLSDEDKDTYIECDEVGQQHVEVDCSDAVEVIRTSNETVSDEASPTPNPVLGNKVPPTLPLILQFDQVLTQKVLCHCVDWLSEWSGIMSEVFGGWVYALLARLEAPLHRDLIASIRQLYRSCCTLRLQLEKPSVSAIEEMETEDGQVHMGEHGSDANALAVLNTLIVISGVYFQQDGAHDGQTAGSDGEVDCEPCEEANHSSNSSSTLHGTSSTAPAIMPITVCVDELEEGEEVES